MKKISDIEISVRDKQYNYDENIAEEFYLVTISARTDEGSFAKAFAVEEADISEMLFKTAEATKMLINEYLNSK